MSCLIFFPLQTGVEFKMRLSSNAIKLQAGLNLQIISASYDVADKHYQKISQVRYHTEDLGLGGSQLPRL